MLKSAFVLPAPAYTYPEFRALVSELAAQHRTTGPDQGPFLLRLTEQNQVHLDAAYALPLRPDLVVQVRNLASERWLVLAEAWCPDTAHTLPVLAHLAAESKGRIMLHVLLRSEHPALMGRHQTEGKDSIPKLIRYDAATGNELGTWGPRPAEAHVLGVRIHADKALHPNLVVKAMNAWYAADAGQSLQRELLAVW